ncbi:hypothetical protein APAC_1956 [Malaciobacter pacificus]|uniref:DUF6471 domain-containing protein n=2 Tax=Malaciobacter pacificus TaxID=1080223 RepID=A0A5C2H9L5_9BACT|nr:hypothetical protein APAC_1956 [Malaciobacter pacificus]
MKMPEDWNQRATAILKSILTRRNIKYHELARMLNGIGIDETQGSISNKISRGTFSFAFFIQCMEVLNINEVRLD